jgi:hypothetical protein
VNEAINLVTYTEHSSPQDRLYWQRVGGGVRPQKQNPVTSRQRKKSCIFIAIHHNGIEKSRFHRVINYLDKVEKIDALKN